MTYKIANLFDKDLDKRQINIAINHCAYLSHVITQQHVFTSRFNNDAIRELRNNISLSDTNSTSINGVYERIKSGQQVGILPFYSFISSISEVNDKYILRAALLQFNVLIAAYELRKLDGYEDYVVRAFDATRILFISKKYTSVLDLLTTRRSYTGKYFRLIRHECGVAPHHLTALASLFDKYSARLPRIQKRKRFNKKSSENAPPIRRYASIDSVVSFEEDEARYAEILASDTSGNTDKEHLLEKVTDEKTATRFIEVSLIAPDEVRRSARLQAQMANSIAANIERREKSLSTEFRYLTQREVKILVDECMLNIDDTSFGLLFLSLVTGRIISELLDDSIVITKAENGPLRGRYVIRYKPSLPNYKIDKKLGKLLNLPTGEVLLILPLCMNNVVSKILCKEQAFDVIKQSVSDCISQINQTKHTRFTLAKVSNVMSFYLIKMGADAADITLLRGSAVGQHAACYYYQVPVQKLIELHQEYLSYLDIDSKYGLYDFKEKTDLTVGSAMQLDGSSAKKLFALLHQSLVQLRQKGWGEVEDLHNYLTVYTLFLLNLSTGHRPVNHPYHSIDSFDLKACTVFISDKESRANSAGRVLKLPPLAIEQLNDYLTHLRHIRHYFAQLDIENGRYLECLFNGERPLFFLIKDNHFLPITPKLLEDFCTDILPLPLNWHRHFVRTWLRKNNAKAYLVDAFMGHVGSDGDPFSRYSGMSMKDLEDVATLLNLLLTRDLDIKSFSSISGLQ